MTQPANVTNLACNKCGATLHVRPGTQYVTCGYCGSQLIVHNDAGTLSTEVLNTIDRRTENIERNVEILRLQQELENLDKNWAANQDNQKQTQAANSNTIKTVGTFAGVAMIGAPVFFGLLFTIFFFFVATMMYKAGAPCIVFIFPLFPIGIIVLGVTTGTATIFGASKMAKLAEEHNKKRQTILDEIEKHKSAHGFNADISNMEKPNS